MLGFVGPFGDSNYGDYAMFVNDVYSLNQNGFMVFTYNSSLFDELERNYLKFCKIEKCVIDVDYTYHETFAGSYHVEYDSRTYTPVEILRKIKNIDVLRESMSRVDILIVCGGGYFNHIWSANHRKARLFSILSAILVASEQHKRIYFMGNTFGPFGKSDDFYSLFFATLNNTVVSARDDILSIAEMRKIGYDKDIRIIPDDLYFLDKRLNQEGKSLNIGHYIIFECYLSLDEIKENIPTIKQFVEIMEGKYKRKVVFLPLDKQFGGQLQGELIKQNVDELVYYMFNGQFLPIEDMHTIIKNADLVISQRYHMFLTALSLNIPCIQILKEIQGDLRYYYTKAKGLLKQVFSNQTFCEEVFLCDNLWRCLKNVEENYDKIVQEQYQYFNPLKVVAEYNMRRERDKYLHEILNSVNSESL